MTYRCFHGNYVRCIYGVLGKKSLRANAVLKILCSQKWKDVFNTKIIMTSREYPVLPHFPPIYTIIIKLSIYSIFIFVTIIRLLLVLYSIRSIACRFMNSALLYVDPTMINYRYFVHFFQTVLLYVRLKKKDYYYSLVMRIYSHNKVNMIKMR